MKSLLSNASIVLLVCGVFFAKAQPNDTKYFKIPEQELTMTQYAKDPGTAAVVLYDVGSTRFTYIVNKGFQVVFERHTRIKILKKEGYEYANISIPLYRTARGKENVSKIRASTFNLENGKPVEVKMEKSAVFEEKSNKYWYVQKFTLPNIREGAVIEYAYEMTSDFLFSLPEWYFQWDIPVAWSEYKVATPEYFRYAQIGQGYDLYEVSETDRESRNISFLYSVDTSNDPKIVRKQTQTETVNYYDNIAHWVQKDAPAFREEPYITSKEDLINKMEHQLASVSFPGQLPDRVIPNWAELAKDLSEDDDFGKFLKKDNAVKATVAALIADVKTDKEKIEAIHNYVKKNYKWNESYGFYASQSVDALLKARSGNGADINLLAVLMLREAGLDAHPVVLSTRTHGKINQAYPLMNKFNHVIAYVKLGDKGIAIDATDPLLPTDMICFEDLNGEGLLVKDDGYEWVMLGDNVKENTYNSIVATLKDGNLNGVVTTGHKGYAAARMRKAIQSAGTENMAKSYLNNYFTEVNLAKSTFENQDDPNAGLKGIFEFSSSTFIEDGGDFVYVNPMLGFGLKENPFKKPERAFPIDFAHPTFDTYQLTFNVPDGYEVSEAPKSMRLANEDGSVNFDYLIENTPKQVKLNYRLSRKRTVFTPEEYVDLRTFYDQIATACSGQLVLKKL